MSDIVTKSKVSYSSCERRRYNRKRFGLLKIRQNVDVIPLQLLRINYNQESSGLGYFDSVGIRQVQLVREVRLPTHRFYQIVLNDQANISANQYEILINKVSNYIFSLPENQNTEQHLTHTNGCHLPASERKIRFFG